MRRVPSARSVTSPTSLSTLRCCETAGRLTGNAFASPVTDEGRSHSIVMIARRDGSARASTSDPASNAPCVTTYVSYNERTRPVKVMRSAQAADDRFGGGGSGGHGHKGQVLSTALTRRAREHCARAGARMVTVIVRCPRRATGEG